MPLKNPSDGRMGRVDSSPVRDLLALIDRPEIISFAGGLPCPTLFDVDGLRQAFDDVFSSGRIRRALQYSSTEGDPDLRELIAARLTGRGLPTTGDSLLVTTGSQQGVSLVATALLEPGDVVLVEEPTYLAALQCFRLTGARIVPVRSDESGLDPEALREAVERERPVLLYLVPTFANPTGRTLTDERRRAVAALSASHGFWILEDDPYGELRYRGTPLAPLSSYPGAEQSSVYLGSLSKIGAPGLRIGWLRAPATLLRALTIAKQSTDLHTSTLDQAAAARYLATVDLDARVRTLAEAYRPRRDAMIDALASVAPEGSTWSDPDGGMFIWARLPGGIDTAHLLKVALTHDVAFVPGAPFYPGEPDPSTLRLSFSTYLPEQIAEGMRRLGAALDEARVE
ncbi:PLP-dependent aminotransferase family protein [Nonomuraea soli]|uniref:DNA-binding transcriptional MocR family regulator n=1 Tax=Nonomuraea soli TaxID=1032476 RepID=A0A7W0CR33_9ACTN|nr:PLP-dependent aminotransferase family protein [Nonomuraea soli]MBA2895771.1 DNA-binding transcriptional MocR family regulator [Nonomuraea soli]